MSNDINLKNIKQFVSGNLTYYLSKIIDLPIHLKEQYYYRLYQCKDDCLIRKRCIKCNCPTLKKAYVLESCNTDRFPNLLPGKEWEEYKIKNNINNIQDIILEVEKHINAE